ncbi:ATP-dependent zinc metalloprotease FtsH [bacterium]|nr:ATP-dependent zinc metalloprotease FtsH [bacterium]
MNGKKRKRPGSPTQKKLNFSISYILLAFVIMYIIQTLLVQGDVEKLPYSEFKALLKEGRIKECTVSPQKIFGVMIKDVSLAESTDPEDSQSAFGFQKSKLAEGEAYFQTVRVEDSDLVKELDAQNVQFTGKTDDGWWQGLLFFWVLPIIILFAIWGLAFRRMNPRGGLMSIGKSKAKIYVEGKTKVTFKDVAGIDEAVEEVQEVVEFLRSPEKFKNLGGQIPKGVLLVGPPGTGKTLLAKAVAGEASVPFFSLSGSDFVEMFVGVGAARVRDLFQQAAQKAPAIVFIDELDALGKARGMNPMAGHDEREQTLNQLLVEMDGFDANIGVIIMAATNRPEILDLALLRPGRFDRQIVVDRPDINGREAILKVHSRKVKLAKEIDLRVIAARTPGFVGADLANVINEAALLAAREGKENVALQDLEEAIDRVVAGLEKKSRVLNKKEKEIVAYHEAGHAIVAASLTDVDPVHRVSIIPRGVAALGYTLQLPTEDRHLMTKTELENRLKVLLGGRVAEQIIFREISTGAQNDLERATAIARSMVTEYGMSEKLGPLSYAKEKSAMFLGADLGGSAHSEQIAAEIDVEVRKIVESAYKDVKSLLSARKSKLEALADLLLEKEVVEGNELEKLLNGKNNKLKSKPDKAPTKQKVESTG